MYKICILLATLIFKILQIFDNLFSKILINFDDFFAQKCIFQTRNLAFFHLKWN